MELKSREEIHKLKSFIEKRKENVVNESWKRMFDQLLVALDHWDAMIARTEVKREELQLKNKQ